MQTPNLQKLLICRNILADDTVKFFLAALDKPQQTALPYDFAAALIARAEDLGLSGNLLRSYLIHLLSVGDNRAAKTAELSNGQIGQSLYQAFCADMEIFQELFRLLPSRLLATKLLDAYQPTKCNDSHNWQLLNREIDQADSAGELADVLLHHYHRYGYGDIAKYRAFRWDSQAQELVGIRHFEDIAFTDLIGYDRQKEILLSNTRAFAAGKPANNVLLVGARGTGKSSSVKALANTYYEQGLRLLQVTKAQLIELPKIMEKLRQLTSKKFIIFLDDLSFEEYEVEYKYLKSAIEGGVEGRPANVLLYATSNRRHLIKETWKDRADEQDELYRNDSVNETISLSDRFGLIINYIAPNQEEYLAIIATLLKKSGIALTAEELRIQALRWEITHSGRSGRIAQQFVTHYLGSVAGEPTAGSE